MQQWCPSSLQESFYKFYGVQSDCQEEVLMQRLDAVEKQDQHLVEISLNRRGQTGSLLGEWQSLGNVEREVSSNQLLLSVLDGQHQRCRAHNVRQRAVDELQHLQVEIRFWLRTSRRQRRRCRG
jgi:hypothetical protein